MLHRHSLLIMRVLAQYQNAALLAVPRQQSVIRGKVTVPLQFGDFGAAIPTSYQAPLPRKAREIYGIWDIGFHKSFKANGGNCDVTEILKRYDYADTRGWVEYCDCMYDKTDPNWARCQSKFCGNVCLAPQGQTGSAQQCCPHESLPGFYSPYSINPGRGAPPWEDFGAGARGLPKVEAGIMADIGAAIDINWDDYQPLKLWDTFWANPPRFALLIGKLNIIPVFGAVVTVALTGTGIPFALIPFAVGDAEKQGKNPSEAILDPVWKHAKKSIGMVLQYVGKCGIGINVTCGAGLIVKRGAQDMIDDGFLTKPPGQGGAYDPTLKAVVAFLARSGDKLVDAVANSLTGDVWGSGIFAVMEAGFGAAATVPEIPEETKKILRMLRTVSAVGNVIASGVAAQKPFPIIADDIAEKLLGFRPSVFFKLKDKKPDAAVAYATTAVDQTGGSLDTMMGVVSDVGTALDTLIAAIEKLSNEFGGGLDEVVKIFSGARNGISQAEAASAAVTKDVEIAAKQAGAGANNPLFKPVPVTLGQIKLQGTEVAKHIAAIVAKDRSVAVRGGTINARVPLPVSEPAQPKPSPKVPAGLPPKLPAKTPAKVQKKTGGGALLATAGLGFAVGGPPGALVGLIAGAALNKK